MSDLPQDATQLGGPVNWPTLPPTAPPPTALPPSALPPTADAAQAATAAPVPPPMSAERVGQLPPPAVAGLVDLGIPQRQSLWAVVLLGLRALRQIGVFQLVVLVGFVIARVPSVQLLIGLVFLGGVVLFAIATLQWWRYTFSVVGSDLVVRRGVLQQQQLTIPLERVQSVSLRQQLLHRVVSTVQVELDTAGTDTAEFVIDALDRPVAEALQAAVAGHRPSQREDQGGAAPRPVQVEDQILFKHGPARLGRVALTQSPFTGLLLIFPLLAIADSAGSFIERVGLDLPEFDGEVPQPGWWLLWFVPLVLIAGYALGVVLNLIRVALSDWNLTVTTTSAGLRRDAGLLSTSSVAATIPRVQVLRTQQGFLERLVSLRRVDLRIIGSADFRVGGCDEDQADMLRRVALPGVAAAPVLDQQVSSAQIFKNTRNTFVAVLPSIVGLWFLVGWWSLTMFVLVPVVAAMTRRDVRLRRWGLTGEALVDHQQFVGWTRNEMLLRKLNGVTLRQSLFERKRGLATVVFASAAGQITIGMIPIVEAKRIRDWGLYHVETDRRPWM